jgi:thioredoxin-like negative regulator of GroEL
MKRPLFMLALLTLTCLSSTAFAQTPTDYATAYGRAQEGDKPLLVLVTATWCPPCQVMKQTTIPQLTQKNAFKGCHWATVDLDQEKELGRSLIGDRGVPQLIMFEKKEGQWVRRYMAGYKSAQVVEAFMARSNSYRTASLLAEQTVKTK